MCRELDMKDVCSSTQSRGHSWLVKVVPSNSKPRLPGSAAADVVNNRAGRTENPSSL